ncbi:MAG: site-specific integrase [Lachnospiraceae bacterium]|nr:site-specific integrase [Lachnospiraceae bacterium]
MAEKRKDSKGRVLRKGEHERKDGRYHYLYLDTSGKRCYVYAKDLISLREMEKEIERDLLDGISNASGKTTLNQLFKMHMELKSDLRTTTRENYNRMWHNTVEASTIGKKKISDIKQVHVKAFYVDCVKAGLKRNTIKLIHNLIFSSFELAVDSDFIRKNPAKGAMENIKQDAGEKIPLSEDEIKRLIDFCINSGTYSIHVPFLTIAIGTCLRCGEITGLTWSDIDMKNRTISVNHQLIYKNFGDGCKFHVSEPKTDVGKRTIPMTETVHRAFVELRKQNLILGRRSDAEVDGYSNFVFVSGNGQPFAINAVNSFLLNMEKAYNKAHPEEAIPHLSAHILRHTGCTLLASAGMDIKALQNVMGHSDASITMNVYNHSSFERTEKEVQRIDNVINF